MNYWLLAIGYLLFAIFAWRRLPWAVLFVIATLPSYQIRFHIGPMPMTLLEGMVLITFAVWLGQYFSSRRPPLVRINSSILRAKSRSEVSSLSRNIPLLLFLLAATLSMFIVPDLRAAAGIWKAYFVEPVLFFAILRDLLRDSSPPPSPGPRPPSTSGRGEDEGQRGSRESYAQTISPHQIIIALSITALFLSIYAIYQRFTGFGIPPPWDVERRVTSIFPYPNALGLFLAPLVPLFIARLFKQFSNHALCYDRSKVRELILMIYWLFVISASVLALVFAQSTGALVGLGTGLFVMALLYVILRPKAEESRANARANIRGRLLACPAKAVAAFGMTVLVVIAVFVVLRSPLRDELLLRDWSGHVHKTQWQETWTMLKNRPILGAGLAGYKETLTPYHKATYLEIFEYPHNLVLNFWSETGLLGLIAFTWLVIIFYKTACKSYVLGTRSYVLGTIAAMVTILVHGLVDVPYFKNDLAILFWIIYTIGVTNHDKLYATSHQTLQTY